jgi:hypothetical protein
MAVLNKCPDCKTGFTRLGESRCFGCQGRNATGNSRAAEPVHKLHDGRLIVQESDGSLWISISQRQADELIRDDKEKSARTPVPAPKGAISIVSEGFLCRHGMRHSHSTKEEALACLRRDEERKQAFLDAEPSRESLVGTTWNTTPCDIMADLAKLKEQGIQSTGYVPSSEQCPHCCQPFGSATHSPDCQVTNPVLVSPLPPTAPKCFICGMTDALKLYPVSGTGDFVCEEHV